MVLNQLNALKNLKKIISPRIFYKPTIAPFNIRCYARKSSSDYDDEPVKFSTSGAIYGISDAKLKYVDNSPWYQGPIVALSILVFLFYFCILREENDVDLELGKSLYDRLEGLEEVNLKVAKKHFLDKGNMKEVDKINARLLEIEHAK